MASPTTTTTTDPCRHPRPKHRTHNPNTGPNREGRERRDGVWVRRDERTEMEKQIREGRERKELKLERKIWRGNFFFFFNILLQYNSKFRIVL